MENKLAENIRGYRKSLGITQEQLAERLGITLGTVSKWERGSSEPDLGFIMELAELFHISVDALIGFSMHGMDADEEAARLEELVNKVTFEELAAEYESALKRFPNHFRIVLGCAEVYKRNGSMEKNTSYVERALSLYRHAVELISQNRDPCISEVHLRNEIAGCYSELKDYKKAIEEYKKNNLSGNSDANIGVLMIWYEKKLQEGIEYTGRAFISMISELTTVMTGFFLYYLKNHDPGRGLRAVRWAIENLKGIKEDPDKRSFLDKIISLYYLFLAIIQDADGRTEDSEESLHTAFRIARAFDRDPVYSLENVIFTEHFPDNLYVYDNAGPTALESLKGTLEEVEAVHPVPEAFMKAFERETARLGNP